MNKIKLFSLFCMLQAVNFSHAEVTVAPDWTRILQANTVGASYVNSIASGAGNVYSANRFSGTIKFEQLSYTSTGITDLLLVKVNNAGVKKWVKQINAQAGGTIIPNTINVDANGSVYVAATFWGTVSIGNSVVTSSDSQNSFYAKFDSIGNGLWATAFNATGTGVSEIAIDDNGNSYLISKTSKLIKFNSSGSLLWEQSFIDRTLKTIAILGTNLYVGGTLQKGSTNTFGTISLTALPGWYTGFIVKANADGVYSASTLVGGSTVATGDGTSVSDIKFDNLGNLLVTGGYTANLELNGTTTISNAQNGYYTYIAKCNQNLSFAWSKSSSAFLNPNRDMSNYMIYTDNTNSIYQTGLISSNFTFGAVSANPANKSQYVVKFDAQGNALTGFSLPNNSSDVTTINQNATLFTGGSLSNLANTANTGDFRLVASTLNTNTNSTDTSWQKNSSESVSGSVRLNYVKHDAAGNYYIQARVVGYCNYFGTDIFVDGYQTIISKHDNTGKMIWMNNIPDYSLDVFGSSFTLDKDNNVISAGLFKNSLTVGTTTLNSNNNGYEGYVVKYSPKGVLIWAKKFDLNANVNENTTLTTDNNGNVIVSGILPPSNFILKFDASGNKQWQKIIPMESYYLSLISTDSNNNIYLTSEIHLSDGTGSTTIDQITLTQSANDGSIALIKFTPEGTAVWAKTYGGVANLGYSDGWPCDIKSDASGNTYLWGWAKNKAAFGAFTLTNPIAINGGYSYVLTKINNTGAVVWAKAIHETKYGFNYGNLLDLDKNGNVYIGGHFNAKINIDGAEFTPEGTTDFFVAKYSNAGEYQWIKTIPASSDIMSGLSVYNEDVVSVIGYVSSFRNSLANTNYVRKGGPSCMVATLGNLPSLTISTDSLTMNATANSSANFSINSNTSWTASSNQSWLTVNAISGTGNSTITLTAQANTASVAREAIVTVFINAVEAQSVKIVQLPNATGISNISDSEMMFYPNPAKNYLHLNSKMESVFVRIYDFSGKMVLSQDVENQIINISRLDKGFYSIVISNNIGSTTRKFVKN